LRRLKIISDDQAFDALEKFSLVPLIRHTHFPFVLRMWGMRDNVNPYDAVFIALAEALGCTLLTADLGMARQQEIYCDVEYVEVA
jgi:predicted nucleic acid-binding protein